MPFVLWYFQELRWCSFILHSAVKCVKPSAIYIIQLLVFSFFGICFVIGVLVLEVFRQYSGIILKVQEVFFLDMMSLDESSSSVSKHQELSTP